MRKKVDWALNLTGIYDLRERSPHEISGGQQQRVAIASVLAMEPEIIVLDEPTSFLDPLSAEKIFEVIYDLNKKQGITVILVEHRLDLTAKYTNHLIVMDEGQSAFRRKPTRNSQLRGNSFNRRWNPQSNIAISNAKKRRLKPQRHYAIVF